MRRQSEEVRDEEAEEQEREIRWGQGDIGREEEVRNDEFELEIGEFDGFLCVCSVWDMRREYE